MKNINLFLVSFIVLLLAAGCNEEYLSGEFEVEETFTPEARTDGPQAPANMDASYDDYCDRVEVAWTPTVRTTAYDLYRDGQLLAQDLTDTFYVDNEALDVEAEYMVYSKNPNSASESFASAFGKKGGVPSTPTGFSASDATSDGVILEWDETQHALYYNIMMGDEVIADEITGTSYKYANAPTTAVEYSLIAYSNCGESDPVTDEGKAGVSTETLDPLDDMSLIASSMNVEILSNNAGGFGGDDGRIARQSSDLAYFIYNIPTITDFEIDMWIVSKQGITSNLKVYISPDGETYTEVAYNIETISEAWRAQILLTPESAIPAGTNYLKIEMSGSDATWKDQIGAVSITHLQ